MGSHTGLVDEILAQDFNLENKAYFQRLWEEMSTGQGHPDYIFICAMIVGDIEIVRFVLNRGLNVPPILPYYVYVPEKLGIFQELINHGWDINKDGHQNLDAIRNENVLRWFLEAAWDPNQPSSSREGALPSSTPLAATYSTTSRLELLISQGARLNPRALFAAMGAKLFPEDGLHLVKFLIKHGNDVNSGPYIAPPGQNRTSPLHYAVSLNRKDFVQILLENGAELEGERFGDNTAASWALMTDRQDLYEMISKWPLQK